MGDNSIGQLFCKFLTRNYFHKHGLKIKERKTGDIWICASVETCYYQWINTNTGMHWGDKFVNSDDPLEKIRKMNYDFILPTLSDIS